MANVLKILGRILGGILEWILFLLILFLFLIRSPQVQTYLGKKATQYLSKELNTKIDIERISIVFLDQIALDGIYIQDLNGDTLVYAKSIFVNISALGLANNKFVIDEIELDQGIVTINRDKQNGDYNYEFIADYFSSGSTSKSKPLDLKIRNLNLININLKYDDMRKDYSDFGMDFDHIHAKNLYAEIEDLHVVDEDVSLKIKNMSLEERSGFVLKSLKTRFALSQKGILLDRLKIKTPASDISAPRLHLLMNSFKDFETFEDSVRFDAVLHNSKIDLTDIAYFATALEGMDQKLTLSGKVTNSVSKLKLTDLYLTTGEKTKIKGTLQLPDFRTIKEAEFNEDLEYAYIDISDITKIKMPKDSGTKFIDLDPMILRLDHVETENLRLAGSSKQFTVSAKRLSTGLGSLSINRGILVTDIPGTEAYAFSGMGADETYDLEVNNFQLGTFLDQSNLGVVDGKVNLSGTINGAQPITFSLIEGQINAFGFNDYTYTNISIENGKFENEVFTADLKARDPNLKLDFHGGIDLKNNQRVDFDMDLEYANLSNLKLISDPNVRIAGKMIGNMTGATANTIEGTINVEDFKYRSETDSIDLPVIDLVVERNGNAAVINLESDVLAATINGEINFETVAGEVIAQVGRIMPAAFNEEQKTYDYTQSQNNFIFSVEIREPDVLLPIIAPGLRIQNNTVISGKYNGKENYFRINAISDFVDYKGFYADKFQFKQSFENDQLDALLTISRLTINDSIGLDSVSFKASGNQSNLASVLSWEPNSINESKIEWNTEVVSLEDFRFVLEPSYFALNGNRWEIQNASTITYSPDSVGIDNFKLSRENQFLLLDGILTRNDSDKLNFKIHDFELDDFGVLIGNGLDLKGTVNGWGMVSNPYTNLKFMADANIENLFLNNEEVGSVSFQSDWNQGNQKVNLEGDLKYRNVQTLRFIGTYDISKKTDNLDFNLVFDRTNIAFANAFLDPEVVSDIDGYLIGELRVTGSPDAPKIKGKLDIDQAQARLALLGALFRFDGKIKTDEYGFYIDQMPVIDEEGNQGLMIGTVYHDHFTNWNFNMSFNLENDARYATSSMAVKPKLSRFLVMDTEYKEGSIYYGKAYVTGTAEISGYADQMVIDVNVTTQKDTKVNFPMYGFTEFDEELEYLTFTSKDSTLVVEEDKFDFTGIDLNLNFNVTPDAELKIIFDEQLEDEITATGRGSIEIQVDNMGDVNMTGIFNIIKGNYNFVMPPIKERFEIREGGVINWTGDPANARIDIEAVYRVNANLADIVPDQVTAGVIQQEVECVIFVGNTLSEPTIRFDIAAPKAAEANQQLINRIRSDKDELNKQFFSLILFKRFQPLTGPGSAGNNAALDVLTTQINNALGQLSKAYKVLVNVDRDSQTGEGSVEVGVQKSFLDERLRIRGNFGVENNSANAAATNNDGGFIGDINIEYLLNDMGTFRISVFNESNTQTILQDQNQGLFTQGVGLTYQEDFNTAKDFKLFQYFLNLFRKKADKRYPFSNSNKRVPLPEYDPNRDILNPQENKSNKP